MNIITYLHNTYTKVVQWIFTKLDDRIWAERLKLALADVDEADLVIYKTLLTNQMNYMRSQSISNPTSVQSFKTRASQIKNDELMFSIAAEVIDYIKDLRSIVGVQPIQGPVGLTFHMVQKSAVDPEKMTSQESSNQILFSVVKIPAEARSRKLGVKFSLELIQDISVLHGLDAANELTPMIGIEISEEILSDILHQLRMLAEKSNNVHEIFIYPTNVDLFVSKILEVSNKIGANTRRGLGNFVVVGDDLAMMLTTSSLFKSSGAKWYSEQTLLNIGTLCNNITVYHTSSITDNTAIVGYKGQSDMDAGLTYAPYIPAISSGIVVDPNTFAPMIGMLTRYGVSTFDQNDSILVGSESYYGVIKVNRLDS